jgi:hypothetical protein
MPYVEAVGRCAVGAGVGTRAHFVMSGTLCVALGAAHALSGRGVVPVVHPLSKRATKRVAATPTAAASIGHSTVAVRAGRMGTLRTGLMRPVVRAQAAVEAMAPDPNIDYVRASPPRHSPWPAVCDKRRSMTQ